MQIDLHLHTVMHQIQNGMKIYRRLHTTFCCISGSINF